LPSNPSAVKGFVKVYSLYNLIYSNIKHNVNVFIMLFCGHLLSGVLREKTLNAKVKMQNEKYLLLHFAFYILHYIFSVNGF